MYADIPGLGHTLGYTGLPSKEDFKKNPEISSEDIIGKDGLEEKYEETLSGISGIKLTERDSQGNPVSESVQVIAQNYQNLTLTIDSKVQSRLYSDIESVVKERDFEGGAAVVIDVTNGNILAMASVPEYSSKVLSEGEPYQFDKRLYQRQKQAFHQPGHFRIVRSRFRCEAFCGAGGFK